MAQKNNKEQVETLGQRIARLRKEKGYTQVELAKAMGMIQGLISDYERSKLRPNPEVLVRFAEALGVSADEILGITDTPASGSKVSLKTLRRLQKIEELSTAQQKTLFKTIDTFLKGAVK